MDFEGIPLAQAHSSYYSHPLSEDVLPSSTHLLSLLVPLILPSWYCQLITTVYSYTTHTALFQLFTCISSFNHMKWAFLFLYIRD